jgi:hypothetical protein
MAWAVQGKLAEYAGKIDYAVEPALGQCDEKSAGGEGAYEVDIEGAGHGKS